MNYNINKQYLSREHESIFLAKITLYRIKGKNASHQHPNSINKYYKLNYIISTKQKILY